jgi:hypothetical protein
MKKEPHNWEAIMSTPHSSLHADHQLDQLAGQFEHWRQNRSHPSERIPQYLWDQAAALALVLPRSRVAQHLRLSPSDLNKHMATRPNAIPATPHTLPSFVEVPHVSACSPATTTIEIELDRPDGARLRLHGAESVVPVADLVRAFLEGAR